jgi:hypothetical protein
MPFVEYATLLDHGEVLANINERQIHVRVRLERVRIT